MTDSDTLGEGRFNGWVHSKKIHAQLDEVFHGADDGELFLENTKSQVLEFSDGKLSSATTSASQGFGLRVVCNERVGFAHSNSLTNDALKSAFDAVSYAKKGATGRWDTSPAKSNRNLYSDANPLELVPIDDKIELLRQIDAYARAQDSRIVQVSASIFGAISIIDILRQGGEHFHDTRPLVQFRVSVVMGEKGRMETGMSAEGGRYDLSKLVRPDDWRKIVDEAIRVAAVNLSSKPAPAGRMTIVLESGWPGVMVHEAVGHGLEGDAIFRDQSVYAGQVGEQVAAKGVTIIDDGTFDGLRGSLSIDDEGTPTQENVLIEDGILKGFMHDRLSARLMNTAPTGNGRRQNYASEVLPRMTNTYMANGKFERDEILTSVKDGLFAVSLGGGQVDPISGDFVFECTEAYKIRDGKIEEALKGATIVGNGPKAMKNVSMVGNDTSLDPGIGTCGKMGQTVPVGVGQPMLRLDDVTVGGTA